MKTDMGAAIQACLEAFLFIVRPLAKASGYVKVKTLRRTRKNDQNGLHPSQHWYNIQKCCPGQENAAVPLGYDEVVGMWQCLAVLFGGHTARFVL